jgi:teichuronic acid biosynthesis protein TuaE
MSVASLSARNYHERPEHGRERIRALAYEHMTIAIQRLQTAFFGWGWPLVAFLPILEVLGRGVFNSLGALYYFWLLISVYGQKARFSWFTISLYSLLLGIFLLSSVSAVRLCDSLLEWSHFLTFSALFVFIQLLLQHSPEQLDSLFRRFGQSALGIVGVVYFKWLIDSQKPDFDPFTMMREDNLPFLTPFILFWLQHTNLSYKRLLMALLLTVTGFYIIASKGRAALLAWGIALLMYAWLVLGWRIRNAMIGAGILLLIGILASGSDFLRSVDNGHTFTERLDQWTSYRTQLWRNALSHPPEHRLTGVGMRNTPLYPEVTTVHVLQPDHWLALKHFHNFLVDTWYETGYLGLTAMLTWLIAVLIRGGHAWHRFSSIRRQQAGVLLSSASAILSGALLSFSYTSHPFALYLFVLLGTMEYLYQTCSTTAHHGG